MARSMSCLRSSASKRLVWAGTQAPRLWEPPHCLAMVCPFMGAVLSAFVPGTGWGECKCKVNPKVRVAMRARFSWKPKARPAGSYQEPGCRWVISCRVQVGEKGLGPPASRKAGQQL